VFFYQNFVCPSHFLWINHINFWWGSSMLRSFRRSSVTSYPIRTTAPPATRYRAPSVYSFLTTRWQFSYSYKTTGRITASYILMAIAGYVSVCVQLYCVGFHSLSLHVSAYMAIFMCLGYLKLHADWNITCNTHWTIQCSRMLKCSRISYFEQGSKARRQQECSRLNKSP
jgi:hypothetical protein